MHGQIMVFFQHASQDYFYIKFPHENRAISRQNVERGS